MIVILAIVLVFSMGFSVFGNVAIAAESETIAELNSISVGHMSDIHYFPLSHCYQDVYNDEDGTRYTDSDFYHSTTGDTKLVLESGIVLNAAIQSIIADGKEGKAPQYLIASGDLSKNGERLALIDVANTLRYLQNEMRRLGGKYANFQVFAIVGNHDLYNHNGSLYSQEDGSATPADMLTAAQFAMIFAGLGFPNATLDEEVPGKLKLTDYFPAEYWYSDYTAQNADNVNYNANHPGYVQSDNASNLSISYYSPALTQATKKVTSADILDCYLNIGDGLGQLTYFASRRDGDAGFSFAIIDSSDREDTDHGALVRISEAEYNKLNVKPALYLDNGNASDPVVDLDHAVNAGEAFNNTEGKGVYRRTPVQHITGGRITSECLDWVEQHSDARNSGGNEETIIASFHHNVLPHFEQEDDILKDFTLYNWENTANRFLDMGIRYALTGHMHASDIMTYTDIEGRTLYDFETGSPISYASPRRYLTFTRNDCDGKLGEQVESEVHILGNIKEIAGNRIPSAADWNESAYQSAISEYKNASTDQEKDEKWQAVVASNPDYLTYIIRYDEFALLDNPDTMYNDFISQDIYGIIVDRMVDHFINQSTIDGLLANVEPLLLGLDNAGDMVNMVLNALGVNGTILNKGAQYMIKVVLNELYGEGNTYPDGKSTTTLDYVLSVVNGILDLEYGDASITSTTNPSNSGKLKVREVASFIMMSHSAGNEISLEEIELANRSLTEAYAEIDRNFKDNVSYGANVNDLSDKRHFRYKQPTNATYRKRMLAALTDFDKQLKNGKVVQDLLDAILNPLLRNDDSILKTLLDYKFDFSKADYTEQELKKVKDLFGNKLNSILTNPLISGVLNGFLENYGITLPENLNLSFDATAVSLNDILDQLLPIAQPFIGDLLGFNLQGDSLVEIVENLLDDYITPSFLVGLGGIASDIVMAFATDICPDTADMKNPAAPYALQPYENYTYAGEKMAYVSAKNTVSAVGAQFNAATQVNGRVPGRVTANFDTKNSTSKFTVKFYTAEDIYGTFKYKMSESDQWITLSTSKENADRNKDYYDSTATATVNGITVDMLTQTKPVYLPLIDLGLLCLTHAEVDYETEQDGKTVTIPYTYKDRDAAPGNSVVFWNVTTVTVSGLSADTTYYYDLEGSYVGSDVSASFSLAEHSGVDYYTFKTAKDSNATKFEFLTIADIQGMIQGMYDDSFKAVEALLNNDATKNFDFILNAGDMCDNGKNFNQWAMALNTYQKLFANTSMFFAAGNHEKGSNALTNYFNYTVSKQNSVDGLYYSFDYANAHLTVLNTNDADSNGLGAAQLSWLENDLKNTNAKWKFVLMHKSLYSGGSHSTDSEVVAMRSQLQTLFAQNGVSIVFGGHDHTYTTTYLVNKDGEAIDKSTSGNVQYTGEGVLYITLGTMGTKFYTYKQNDDILGNFDADKSILETLTTQTFGKVVVDGDTLTYTGYTYNPENGQLSVIGESKLAIPPEKGGLSKGAIIAISVVIPVVVLSIVAVVVVIVVKKQQQKKKEELRRKKIAALKRAKALAMAKARAEQAATEANADTPDGTPDNTTDNAPTPDNATADSSESTATESPDASDN